MLRLLPLCLLLTACGDEAPEPVVVSDTDIAVVDAAPDTFATQDEATDALVDEPIGDAAAADEPPADAAAPSPLPDAEAEPDAAQPAAAPERNVLVDGTGGDGTTVEDGVESYDMAAPALADVFSEAMYIVRGAGGVTLLIERGADKTQGTFTRSAQGQEDETGTWTLEGGTLTLDGVTYTITSRGLRDLTFSGPDGDLVLDNTAG